MGKFRNITDEKFRDKLRVLMKLKEGKIQSEKDLQKLSTATMLSIPGITVHDMHVIIEYQKAARENRLLSFLLQSEGMKALAGLEEDEEGEETNGE